MLLLASQGSEDGVSFNSPTGDPGPALTLAHWTESILCCWIQWIRFVWEETLAHEILSKSTGTQDFIQLHLLNLINAGFTRFESPKCVRRLGVKVGQRRFRERNRLFHFASNRPR